MFILLLVFVKGDYGNGYVQADSNDKLGQAFESSISKGRYALILSVVEYSRLDLPKQLADFGSPDVARSSNGYVSIFPPAAALVSAPVYWLGTAFNIGQLSTYAFMSFVTFINCLLIIYVTSRLKINRWIGLFSSIAFVFATASLPYSYLITQHQLTAMIALLLIGLLLEKPSTTKHILFWLLYGFSALLDIPNVILLLPFVIYLVFTELIVIKDNRLSFSADIHCVRMLAALTVIVPVVLYLSYNFLSSGNILSVGQFLPRYTIGDSSRFTSVVLNQVPTLPFDITQLHRGLVILLFGFERSILFFSPFVYLSLLGLPRLYTQNKRLTQTLIGAILANIFIYATFSDVWGGYSFGSRYLIFTYALSSICIASAIARFSKSFIFNSLMLIGFTVGVTIHVLGALTTTLIPPVHEAIGLRTDPTIQYAIDVLGRNHLESFAYKNIFSTVDSTTFYMALCGIILSLSYAVYLVAVNVHNEEN